MRVNLSTPVWFVCCAATFIGYLISTKIFGIYVSQLLFWVSLGLMAIIVVYQATTIKDQDREWLVLAQIAILLTLVRITYRMSGTMWPGGEDAYDTYYLARSILATGSLSQFGVGVIGVSGEFPLAFIYASEANMITGVGLYNIVNWFPSIFSLGTILGFYLLVHELFSSKKVSLLATYSFAMLSTFVQYDSVFIKEVVAFPLFIGALYAYFKARRSGNGAWIILSITLSIACVFAHHLTAFLMMAFYILVFGVDQIGRVLHVGSESEYATRIGSSYMGIIVVLVLGYWAILRQSPLTLLISFYQETMQSPSLRPNVLQTYYGISSGSSLWMLQVAKYSDFVAAGVIGFCAICALFHKTRRFEVTFAIWGILMGSLAILRSEVGTGLSGTAWGDRLLNFGYLTLLPLSTSLFSYEGHRRERVLRGILLTTIVAYSIIGVLHVPPSLYTISKNPYAVDGRRYYLLPVEEQAASWFNATGYVAVDQRLDATAMHGLLYNIRSRMSQGLNMSAMNETCNCKISSFNYAFSVPPESSTLSYEGQIYDNGFVEIFYVSK